MSIAAVSNLGHTLSHTVSQPNYLKRLVTTVKNELPFEGPGKVFVFSQVEDSQKTILIPQNKIFKVERSTNSRSDLNQKVSGFVGVTLKNSNKELKKN